MTVDALLKQLKGERMDAMTWVWIYGAKSQEAKRWGDTDVANMYKQIHDDNYKKAEQLSMIIKEIEKRIS